MLYQEYISKVNALCINIDEGTNVAYINPDYRYLLSVSGLEIADVTDFKELDFEIVKDELQKTVDAYNTRNNKLPGLIEFVSTVLLDTIPAITTDEVNNIIGVFNKYAEFKKVQNQNTPNNATEIKARFDAGPLNLSKKNV